MSALVVMASIYFSHSYRPPDQSINKYFLSLLQGRGLMPSIDVPSNRLNSAKCERQLGFTRGLISIVPFREDAPTPKAPLSPYIRHEILTGVRAGKPVLVFAEDTLPTGLFPQQVMEERFSRKSFWRDAREHLQSIDSFHAFVGRSPSPRGRITNVRRYAVAIGFSQLTKRYADRLESAIQATNYDVKVEADATSDASLVESYHSIIRGAALVIAFTEKMTTHAAYSLGIARAAATPTITLQFADGACLLPGFPTEHGPRTLPIDDVELGGQILRTEIEIFEDEAIEIDRQDEIGRYLEFLQSASGTPGVYDAHHRSVFINNFRDTYNVAQAGVVGNEATFAEGDKK